MDWRVSRLVEYVDRHAGAVGFDLGHACLELRLDISSAYAARLFRRDTGMSFREYAKKQRSLAATGRLNATELPVKVIAVEMGYRQPSHFIRFFKQQQHRTPAMFRRNNSARSPNT